MPDSSRKSANRWLFPLIAGVLLCAAGFRALLYGGGAGAGALLSVIGIGLVVLGEYLRRRAA